VSTAASPTTPKRRSAFEYLIEVPAVIVTFVMMFHITANAILRTFWDAPLPDTLEITQYWYLPIVAFLGFVAAQHRGQHIAADLIFERLPHVVKPYVLALMWVLCALVAAGFAWFSFPEAMHSFEIRRTAGVSDLISWPTYFLPPIAFTVLTVQFVWAAVRSITDPALAEAPVIGDIDDALLLDETAHLVPPEDEDEKLAAAAELENKLEKKS
jgi:TRAP-type C4-dicarboxylate transport system permease small subunit